METAGHLNGHTNGTPRQVGTEQSSDPIRIAYLVSRYPAVSHTFILREVQRLRSANFEIHVASINLPDRVASVMTSEERDESAATFYVKREGVRGAISAHVAVLMSSPRAYFKGLGFALKLGGADLRRLVLSFCYFVEAVVLGHWMESRGLRHLHVHFANAAATVGLIASHTFPIEFSLTVHGPDEFYDVTDLRLSDKMAGASFACCIGQFARSQLMKLSPPVEWGKFEIGPLGTSLPTQSSSNESGEVRNRPAGCGPPVLHAAPLSNFPRFIRASLRRQAGSQQGPIHPPCGYKPAGEVPS